MRQKNPREAARIRSRATVYNVPCLFFLLGSHKSVFLKSFSTERIAQSCLSKRRCSLGKYNETGKRILNGVREELRTCEVIRSEIGNLSKYEDDVSNIKNKQYATLRVSKKSGRLLKEIRKDCSYFLSR